MRILQLAPIWETVPPPAYGGTEVVVSVLTEELVRRGHDVTLWASGDSRTAAHLKSVVPRSLRAADLTQSALQYAAIHVASAIREAGDFDVIHNHNGPPSELAMAAAQTVGTPFLTTLHCLPTEDTRFIWERYTCWYNAISEQQSRVIEPFPLAKFAGVVHNSIDVDSFPFERDKEDYLLYVGRMTPEKPPHVAVEVASRVGMRLVIAAKIGLPREQDYYESVLKPALQGSTATYFGEANAAQKRELFSKARCLLLPLFWEEPFGLVMIEAMACGTPVIAFSRGAAPEIVQHGINGFLVDDADGMVAAISHLDEIDPDACRRSVEERFSASALADRYLDTYRRMLAGYGSAPAERVMQAV